jgi:phosphoserine aminotransferase
MGLVFEWIKNQGGVTKMHEFAVAKSQAVYEVLANSGGFYQ